jgi:putative glycosyltransferase (TIGR04348 family)
MKIIIITPAGASSRAGNRITAQRWARFLREMGHKVTLQSVWNGQAADLMLALHARRSHDSIKRFAARWPGRPLIVVLTGTDLYRDIRTDPDAQESMRLATRLVVLQEQGLQELAPEIRAKTNVVVQSAQPHTQFVSPPENRFVVCVIGHLREEKDPFRTALALPLLPPESRIELIHMGRALNPEMAQQARELMATLPRYHWLDNVPHWQVRRKLVRSHLMVISSRMEGGANVVSEALAAGVPMLASAIPGNIGLLGPDYAGYYPLGDETALAQLLTRAESSPEFYALLKRQCASRAALADPKNEQQGLAMMLREALDGTQDRA